MRSHRRTIQRGLRGGAYRVSRGGSWFDAGEVLPVGEPPRATSPVVRINDLGFRASLVPADK